MFTYHLEGEEKKTTTEKDPVRHHPYVPPSLPPCSPALRTHMPQSIKELPNMITK